MKPFTAFAAMLFFILIGTGHFIAAFAFLGALLAILATLMWKLSCDVIAEGQSAEGEQ
jgi:hypothetical protein